jgi:hypothetical protein
MLYRVMKQYARGTTETLAGQFNDAADATLFIQAKLRDDLKLKVRVIYRLFEGSDFIKEFTEAQIDDKTGFAGSSGSSSGSTGSAGSQQRTSFQPTPFNPSPRPPGIPHSWIKDEPDDKKDKK